jgi:hypothetical protein
MSMAAPREMSFRDYIRTRRYQFGRGSKAGWLFVARALGDANLPDATSWPELRAYLTQSWEDPAAVDAAQVVWNSYLSLLTKKRSAALGRNSVPRIYADGSMGAWGAV